METARKLYKYFLGGDTRRIHKRQVLRNFFDAIMVIDSSSSVSSGEFAKGLAALQQLVEKSRNDTNYAAITYASHSQVQFNFSLSDEAIEKFSSIKRSGGKTNTQEALKLCQKMFAGDEYGSRKGSFRRILVVTDGQSNIKRAETVPSAVQLKLQGVDVFVIAVGEYLDGIQEMVQMASSTGAHMYRVMNMRGLAEIVKLIPERGQRPWIDDIFGGTEDNSNPLGRL